MAKRRRETERYRRARGIQEHAQRRAVVLGARVREVAEQSDHPQLADALKPRGLGEDDTVVSRRDAVAPEPGLKLEVHTDGSVD